MECYIYNYVRVKVTNFVKKSGLSLISVLVLAQNLLLMSSPRFSVNSNILFKNSYEKILTKFVFRSLQEGIYFCQIHCFLLSVNILGL